VNWLPIKIDLLETDGQHNALPRTLMVLRSNDSSKFNAIDILILSLKNISILSGTIGAEDAIVEGSLSFIS